MATFKVTSLHGDHVLVALRRCGNILPSFDARLMHVTFHENKVTFVVPSPDKSMLGHMGRSGGLEKVKCQGLSLSRIVFLAKHWNTS